ncbi:MAG: PEP-CTERM sorting domain-containing protein [Planctomycetota bacterium]
MKTLNTNSLAALACSLAAASIASADVLLTGVYDETGNANEVDVSATDSTVANQIGVDDFAALIAANFDAQQAGVISFDTGLQNDGAISSATFSNARFDDATTGDIFAGIQRTVAGTNTQVKTATNGSGRTPISGTNGFGGSTSFGFEFDPDDALVAVGLTFISRSGQSTGNATATATFVDPGGANPQDVGQTVAVGSSDGGDDTFFGFTAPDGKVLAGVQIDLPYFTWIDDIGLSKTTVIPEPGVLSLLGLGAACLLCRQRRAA